MVVQNWYLFQTKDWSDENAAVGIAAAVFSGMQILSTCSAAHTQSILAKYQNSVVFEFKVLGLGKKHRKLQTQTRDIGKDIAHFLEIHEDVVQIERPHGFRFKMHLFVNELDLNGAVYKDLLRNAVRDGTVGEIIMKNWKLDEMPAVRDLDLAPQYLLNGEDNMVPKKGEKRKSRSKIAVKRGDRINRHRDSPSLLLLPQGPDYDENIDEKMSMEQDEWDKDYDHVAGGLVLESSPKISKSVPKHRNSIILENKWYHKSRFLESEVMSREVNGAPDGMVFGQNGTAFVLESKTNDFGYPFDVVGEHPEVIDFPNYYPFHTESDMDFVFPPEPYVRVVERD